MSDEKDPKIETIKIPRERVVELRMHAEIVERIKAELRLTELGQALIRAQREKDRFNDEFKKEFTDDNTYEIVGAVNFDNCTLDRRRLETKEAIVDEPKNLKVDRARRRR